MPEEFLTDARYSAALVLIAFAALVLLVGLLYQVGLLFRIVGLAFYLMRKAVHGGFALWRCTLTWMSWQALLGIVAGVHLLLFVGLGSFPFAIVFLGSLLLALGVVTCLAYVYIDAERDEVERGYKVLHNPLKGQEVAENLVLYGQRAGFMMLLSATFACVAGFALLNLGVYQSVGEKWYALSTSHSRVRASPFSLLFSSGAFYEIDYTDFLVYTLIHLTYVVDLLDVTNRIDLGRVAFVHPIYWPAATLLTLFKAFFTLVLLQQIYAAIRRVRALGEAVRDFWSPYEPIHKRAVENLRQQGGWAAAQLLHALETVAPLTADQRGLLPQLLAGMGPSTIPVLEQNLRHPNPEVRTACVAALGHLEAWRALAAMVPLAGDAEESVRLALAEAVGYVCRPGAQVVRKRWSLGRKPVRRWLENLRRKKNPRILEQRDPVELCLGTLRRLLKDDARSVRREAAKALADVGPAAAAALPELVALARDEDAEVRAIAAQALGAIKGPAGPTLKALLPLLEDPTPTVLVPAARALGAFGKDAAPAVPALIALVQHAEDEVRTAVAEAIGNIGKLDHTFVPQLVAGLKDEDNLVRARAAEALGTIGPTAAMTATDLVMALKDENDRVRARAAWALGQLGPEPTNLSVPGLKRALEDPDYRVVSLAVEALGNLGAAALPVAPALLEATGHINVNVRLHAAQAACKLGLNDDETICCYEKLTHDAEGPVRKQAVLCLGSITRPADGVDRILLGVLEDADPQVRSAAVAGLGRRLNGNPALMATVLRATEDVDAAVRVEAATALGQAEEVSVTTVERLGRLLGDDADEVSRAATAALGKLGPRAAASAGALHELVKTGTAELREHALRALVQIMPPEALEAFTTAMGDAEPHIRRLASAGLMKLKALPPESMALIVEGLKDADVQVRSNIAYVCGRLENLPSEVVPLLLERTADHDDGLRLNAVRALQDVPLAGTEEALTPLLDDLNPQIGLLAARALLAKSPDHAKAWETVGAALTNSNARLRELAAGVVETCALSPGVVAKLAECCAIGEANETIRQRLSAVLVRLKEAANAMVEARLDEPQLPVAP